jgi:hypothetical protein
MIPRKAVLVLLLAAAAMIAGCGRRAQLDRPAPLTGAAAAREQAANRAHDAGALVGDPQAPQSVDEVRNQPIAAKREAPVPQ